jgi:aspartate/methionine/tyrosine aminotransferase
LICSEVYLEFVPPAERRSAVHLAPNVASIGSLTKAYGLGGLRLGWVALGEGLAADRARIEDAAFLVYVDPPTPVLRLATRAVERLDALREPYLRLARESKPILLRWLAETDGVEAAPPAAGLICFPRIEGVRDTLALHEYLVREHDVGVVPGEYFGAGGHVRVGYALEPHRLREALERLAAGINAFRG